MSNKDTMGVDPLAPPDDFPPMTVKAAEPLQHNLSFATNRDVLFTIRPDGTIERGPAFTTTDEASLEFWRMIAASFPAFREALLRGGK